MIKIDKTYDELLKKIELLEWKIEILQDNVTCKSFFNIFLEMNLTKQQHNDIVNLIQEYADNWKDEYNRHTFEDEMTKIDDRFAIGTQTVELILRDLAEEENDYNYKVLFKRLYGHMLKYDDVFPDVSVNK